MACCAVDPSLPAGILMKRILFLTSTNLAANPRLVKELRLAKENGFSCSVIQFILGNWSDDMTKQMEASFSNVEFVHISALRKPFFPWFLSSVLSRIYSMLPASLLSARMLSIATGKRSLLILRALRQLRGKFDWVVAHNPATFYPAMSYSRSTGARLGIDVEDYHPGECTDPRQAGQLREMMCQVLPGADYVSAASPLILKAVQADMGATLSSTYLVYNYFPATEFVVPSGHRNDRLQVAWFSQHITAGRGIEDVLPAIISCAAEVDMHLFGKLDQAFFETYLQGKGNIHVHPPLQQQELHAALSSFDIGLALEDRQANLNRDLCITNKLLAFFQAGLYIVASDTSAQRAFFEQFPDHGQVSSREALKDSATFLALWRQRNELREQAKKRFQQASIYDASKELRPLLQAWNSAN
jgi:hypothetical protein